MLRQPTHTALPVCTITPALDLSAQFLALCMLAHPRCSLGPTASFVTRHWPRWTPRGRGAGTGDEGAALGVRLVWDWVLRQAPLARVALRLANRRVLNTWESASRFGEDSIWEAPVHEALVALTVSRGTLGVWPGHTRQRVRDTGGLLLRGYAALEFVGANGGHVIERVGEPAFSAPPYECFCGSGSTLRVVEPPTSSIVGCNHDGGIALSLGGRALVCCNRSRILSNRKWLIIREFCSKRLIIVNLLLAKQQRQHNGAGEGTPNQQQPEQESAKVVLSATANWAGIFLDEYHCDEALFVSFIRRYQTLQVYVVSLPQLWSCVDTDGSTVERIAISTTLCRVYFSESYPTFDPTNWLVMHNTESKRRYAESSHSVLECKSLCHNNEACKESLLHVSEYRTLRLEVSQLSERLFCVSYCGHQSTTYEPPPPCTWELWDCNLPTRPLRVVEFRYDQIQAVFGHCGFLFHLTADGASVVVSDFESGTKVAVITCNGESRKKECRYCTDTSFLF
ncbi:hypothetical protein Pelo_4434 [Pelomyxa schiedti]|nr:hypothetical protein Pelo_4434 [Pelomyxa schiedti]